MIGVRDDREFADLLSGHLARCRTCFLGILEVIKGRLAALGMAYKSLEMPASSKVPESILIRLDLAVSAWRECTAQLEDFLSTVGAKKTVPIHVDLQPLVWMIVNHLEQALLTFAEHPALDLVTLTDSVAECLAKIFSLVVNRWPHAFQGYQAKISILFDALPASASAAHGLLIEAFLDSGCMHMILGKTSKSYIERRGLPILRSSIQCLKQSMVAEDCVESRQQSSKKTKGELASEKAFVPPAAALGVLDVMTRLFSSCGRFLCPAMAFEAELLLIEYIVLLQTFALSFPKDVFSGLVRCLVASLVQTHGRLSPNLPKAIRLLRSATSLDSCIAINEALTKIELVVHPRRVDTNVTISQRIQGPPNVIADSNATPKLDDFRMPASMPQAANIGSVATDSETHARDKDLFIESIKRVKSINKTAPLVQQSTPRPLETATLTSIAERSIREPQKRNSCREYDHEELMIVDENPD